MIVIFLALPLCLFFLERNKWYNGTCLILSLMWDIYQVWYLRREIIKMKNVLSCKTVSYYCIYIQSFTSFLSDTFKMWIKTLIRIWKVEIVAQKSLKLPIQERLYVKEWFDKYTLCDIAVANAAVLNQTLLQLRQSPQKNICFSLSV